MKNIVILISGGGSNMAAIVKPRSRKIGRSTMGRVAAVLEQQGRCPGVGACPRAGHCHEVLDHKAFESREAF